MKLDTTNIQKTLQQPIVLIGMMGTGKTHLGKLLANELNMEFFDSDQVVEKRGGLTINEIFELYGEERFRQAEEKTVLELLNAKPSIIATGGGAPMNAQILGAIKKQSISIWLNSNIETIYERIKQTKNRPLLKTDNPKETLSALLDQRKDTYAKANIKIDINANNADKALQEIIEAISELI
ncbi:MAG: shikimate kinase [Bdellovibrionales bacterium]